ncbi:MAG: type II secretion system F family protein [Fimbriimonas ginsengisoli]|uniref:Type II secretion system F family protein n=1 Tax=Fimbriimonas ginsengisoli TaxID=1005039 RepID=A0A931PUX3_FIMGI|nr:type II secretion system F family protein [Fimbriimonas ginsengisoli]
MPFYAYTAIDASGRTVRATIEADSEQLVLGKLRDQSMHCTDIREVRGKSKNRALGPKKIKLKALVVFSRQFATMIDAGIPILRCLEILVGQAKDPLFRQVLEQVMIDVKGGLSLNDAMLKHPTVFNKLYVNMIRAAELGGILDQILDRLAGFLEYEAEVRGKIKGAMTYPVLVLIFSQIMLFALFSFVLPKFKDIFTGMDVELPPITAGLFALGDFMAAYWWLIIVGMVGAFFALKVWIKTPQGRYQFDSFKLRVPIAGELSLKMSVARFSRTFGTLISSGVPMMRSLEIVGETLGNVVLAEAIEQTRMSIREGQKLSVPLQESGLFPTMVTCMIDVGEESGRLPEMLVKVAEFYDTEVEATVKGLTSLIEPMLIIFMGVVVGFIAISIMTPIFKLVSSIK